DRKRANRAWRQARRGGAPVTELEAKRSDYQIAKTAVRRAVDKELTARDSKAFQKILTAPKNQRCREFWRYVQRNRYNPRQTTKVRNDHGALVPAEEMSRHLTQ